MSAPATDLEEVSIDVVQVGDHVCAPGDRSRNGAKRCVISRAIARHGPTNRAVGWILEFFGGETAWWPPGATVWRLRYGV